MIILWTCRIGKRTEPRLFETHLCCFNRISNMFEVQIPIKTKLAHSLFRATGKNADTEEDMLRGAIRMRSYTRHGKEVNCWIYEQHFPFNSGKSFHNQHLIYTLQAHRTILRFEIDALALETVIITNKIDELYKM